MALREQVFLVQVSDGIEWDRAKVALERELRVALDFVPERGVTQSVVSSRVLGTSTILASAMSIRQQVSSEVAITSRSVGKASGTRARVRKLLVKLFTLIGFGSMLRTRRSVVRSASPIPRALPRVS